MNTKKKKGKFKIALVVLAMGKMTLPGKMMHSPMKAGQGRTRMKMLCPKAMIIPHLNTSPL